MKVAPDIGLRHLDNTARFFLPLSQNVLAGMPHPFQKPVPQSLRAVQTHNCRQIILPGRKVIGHSALLVGNMLRVKNKLQYFQPDTHHIRRIVLLHPAEECPYGGQYTVDLPLFQLIKNFFLQMNGIVPRIITADGQIIRMGDAARSHSQRVQRLVVGVCHFLQHAGSADADPKTDACFPTHMTDKRPRLIDQVYSFIVVHLILPAGDQHCKLI